jgi:antitoxin component of MazEF toxin-antitoxin module
MTTATATLRQSGGSLIMAIPKVLIDVLGLSAGSQVSLSVQGRALTITPSFNIDEMVAAITPENSHELLEFGERGAEKIDW